MSRILKLNPVDYRLSPVHLDNLASEFVGKLLSVAGDNEEETTMEFEFDTEEHRTTFQKVLDEGFKK